MATEKPAQKDDVVKDVVCPIYIVDAFTDKPFSGNPAAVCLIGDKVQLEQSFNTRPLLSF